MRHRHYDLGDTLLLVCLGAVFLRVLSVLLAMPVMHMIGDTFLLVGLRRLHYPVCIFLAFVYAYCRLCISWIFARMTPSLILRRQIYWETESQGVIYIRLYLPRKRTSYDGIVTFGGGAEPYSRYLDCRINDLDGHFRSADGLFWVSRNWVQAFVCCY